WLAPPMRTDWRRNDIRAPSPRWRAGRAVCLLRGPAPVAAPGPGGRRGPGSRRCCASYTGADRALSSTATTTGGRRSGGGQVLRGERAEGRGRGRRVEAFAEFLAQDGRHPVGDRGRLASIDEQQAAAPREHVLHAAGVLAAGGEAH